MWWGLALAKGDKYLEIAVSTKKCGGKYHLAQPDNADEDANLWLPFDHTGQHTPLVPQTRPGEFFTHAISGPQRPTELDPRVINTVLRGAKRAFSSKKAKYTVQKYLTRHQKQPDTVSVGHVAKDVQYISVTDISVTISMISAFPDWMEFGRFATRPVAEKKLLDFVANEEDPDNFLEQLGDKKNDVIAVGAALSEGLQWGESTYNCEDLVYAIFACRGKAT
ncbi:hypothetical protein WJX77_001698 [Trebouxia sp. C0004]